MKKLELAQATACLADYVHQLNQEPLIISIDGQPVAVLMPIQDADMETVSLSLNHNFIAMLEESRAKLRREGGISLENLKREFIT